MNGKPARIRRIGLQAKNSWNVKIPGVPTRVLRILQKCSRHIALPGVTQSLTSLLHYSALLLTRPEQIVQFLEPTEFQFHINLEIKMLKNIIALAIVAAFGSSAFAQTPAAVPAKPAEIVKPAAATAAPAPAVAAPVAATAAKPEAKPAVAKAEKKAKAGVTKKAEVKKPEAASATAPVPAAASAPAATPAVK